MSGESRKEGGRYYTRSRRVNGRLVREYVGTGFIAELAHQEDVAKRKEKEAARREFQSIKRCDEEVDELVE